MRYYGFGNYYLSSLQQGLQASHVIGELWSRYSPDSIQGNLGREWAANHKTMVLLNGGNSASLEEIFQNFERWAMNGMTLPYAKFHEDEMSLGGALTATGIVLTEKYYNAMGELRQYGSHNQLIFTDSLKVAGWLDWEIELVVALSPYGLAH